MRQFFSETPKRVIVAALFHRTPCFPYLPFTLSSIGGYTAIWLATNTATFCFTAIASKNNCVVRNLVVDFLHYICFARSFSLIARQAKCLTGSTKTDGNPRPPYIVLSVLSSGELIVLSMMCCAVLLERLRTFVSRGEAVRCCLCLVLFFFLPSFPLRKRRGE